MASFIYNLLVLNSWIRKNIKICQTWTNCKVCIHRAPVKFSQNCKQVCSAYTKATATCNTAIEREFCGVLEYVWHQNVRRPIKSTYTFNWNSADFDKLVIFQILRNFWTLSNIWKLPWSMTSNLLTLNFHWPQNCLETRGRNVQILALVVKSGICQNGL